MADIAALRTCLRDSIDLGMDVQGTDRANEIIVKGINSVEDLIDLYKDTGIKVLCSNMRKPKGIIPDHDWVAPDPNPDRRVVPHIPTPGRQVPAICEQRLNLAAYGATIYLSINRLVDTVNLTRSRLRKLKSSKKQLQTIRNQNQ